MPLASPFRRQESRPLMLRLFIGCDWPGVGALVRRRLFQWLFSSHATQSHRVKGQRLLSQWSWKTLVPTFRQAGSAEWLSGERHSRQSLRIDHLLRSPMAWLASLVYLEGGGCYWRRPDPMANALYSAVWVSDYNQWTGAVRAGPKALGGLGMHLQPAAVPRQSRLLERRQMMDRSRQHPIALIVSTGVLVISVAWVILLVNRDPVASGPGQTTSTPVMPPVAGPGETPPSASVEARPVGTRMMAVDSGPETPIPDPTDLAEFRAQLRRRLLCTPDEAIWWAQMLTGTTEWIRSVVKRTSLIVATRWADGQPAGNPSEDNSHVVWLVLFESGTQLTHRSRFDTRFISPPVDATEDAYPIGTTYMAVIFEETGQFPSPLLEVYGNDKTIEEIFESASNIPELGSGYLERYPINTAGLCHESPGSRPTPGATWIYPTAEVTP